MTRAGPSQPGTVERATLWVLLLILTLVLIYSDWLWRWNQLLYDAQLRLWSRPPAEDVVIVAIDEASLREIGHWPWPRAIHAELIDRLTDAGARAIAMDIIFAESTTDDADLAGALARNGRTVLPVAIERTRLGGQLVETLPVTQLAVASRSLGHVHVEIDPDGIVRSAFLLEGLGSPHWPHLALALLRLAGERTEGPLPGVRNPNAPSGSPFVVVRDHQLLIPFAGPPGHYRRLSYVDALRGRLPQDAFRDKLVLVGVAATGLGDALPTPVSGHNQSMPGIEIIANIVDALRQDLSIAPMPMVWRLPIGGILVLAPALVFTLATPRASLVFVAGLMLATMGLSLVLLHGVGYWFPPAAVLFTLALSYPLWSWRRLEYAMRYLDRELAGLKSELAVAPTAAPQDRSSTLTFVAGVLPVSGWSVIADDGRVIDQKGDVESPPSTSLRDDRWQRQGRMLWRATGPMPARTLIGLRWRSETPPGAGELAMLDELVRVYEHHGSPVSGGTLELLQNRIQQVQQATRRLRALRKFVADTVAQMADGVVVVNRLGTVVLANEHAALYLSGDASARLSGRPILAALQVLRPLEPLSWEQILGSVLLAQDPVQIDVQSTDGRDLLVQMSPLSQPEPELNGLIINLSDISPLKESERRRSEVLGFLSHDLRSPLVSLLALLELSTTKTPDKELLALLQRMQGHTESTLSLAEQFLQLARAESRESIEYSDNDLVSIALNALEQVWAQAEKKAIALNSSFAVETAWTRVDPRLVERALTNLLTNAVQYSPAGTSVELSLTRSAGSFACCVSDQGPGIAAEDMPRLFDRFQRLRRSVQSDERGAGLGLAFVKIVAEEHGGRVQVSSELGRGSRFCLELPEIICDRGELDT